VQKMHFLRTVLVLVSLLASAALSKPTPQNRVQKRSFIHRVRRSVNTYGPSAGAAAMAKAYRKYGFQLDSIPAVSNAAATAEAGQVAAATAETGQVAAATAETGQVAAVPVEDESVYVGQVSIGGQMLTMDFDTGSSDLYVSPASLRHPVAANMYQVGFLKPSFAGSYWPAYRI